MNHFQILKRSWKILWSYPALWIFGIIIALSSARSDGGSNGGGSSSSQGGGSSSGLPIDPSTDMSRAWDQLNHYFANMSLSTERTIIAVIISLVCLAILLALIFRIGYYVSNVSLIRMVDGYEKSGEKVTWKQGFRLGWSRSAWRLFLIDLIIFLPIILVILVLVGIAALPIVTNLFAAQTISFISFIPAVGLFFLVILVIIAVVVLVSLFMEIIRRVCVLQEKGPIDAIREGWQAVRRNFKDVFLMWLILVGIRIAYIIVLIPVVVLALIAGLLVGGGFGAVLYFIVQAAANVTAGWITAGIVGVLLFILFLAAPLAFVGGLLETYLSSVWTLVYRELKPMLPREAPQMIDAEPLPPV
jgi:hypothetical protein